MLQILLLLIVAVSSQSFTRYRKKQCYAFPTRWRDNYKNPWFSNTRWSSSMRVSACMDACRRNSDRYGRPCVGIEVSTTSYSHSTYARCYLLWGCSIRASQSWTTVYLKNAPTSPPTTRPPTTPPPTTAPPTTAPPTTPSPYGPCTPTYTDLVLGKLTPASDEFAKCNSDVQTIATTLVAVAALSAEVTLTVNQTQETVEKINEINDNVHSSGIVNMLGKIPKIGIFIKLGMKAADKMIEKLEEILVFLERHMTRINKVVQGAKKVFVNMAKVTTPTSAFLSGANVTLHESRRCMVFSGECDPASGSVAGNIEGGNQEAWPKVETPLGAIKTGGEVCHAVFNPMVSLFVKIKGLADLLKALLEPIQKIMGKVNDFMTWMAQKIQEFKEELEKSLFVQCGMEIFQPITGAVNLGVCPLVELEQQIMFNVVDPVMAKIAVVINDMINGGITAAVDALVPGNFEFKVDDFREDIKPDTWFAVCAGVAALFPEHNEALENLTKIELPKTYNQEDLKDAILSEVLFDPIVPEQTYYTDACSQAWNDLWNFDHMQNCWTIINTCNQINQDLLTARNEAAAAALDEQTYLTAYNNAVQARDDAEDALGPLEDRMNEAGDLLEETQAGLVLCHGCTDYDINCLPHNCWEPFCVRCCTCYTTYRTLLASVIEAQRQYDQDEKAYLDQKKILEAAQVTVALAMGDLTTARELTAAKEQRVADLEVELCAEGGECVGAALG